MKNKKIYLDYAATTPVDPRVLKEMNLFFSRKFGNTMSPHSFGQEAKIVLEESREKVANFINANSEEIFFTSSATESNNIALKGIAFKKKNGSIIISNIEHPCVKESAEWLGSQGFKIIKIKVDKYGLVDPKDILKNIRKDTILVSVIYASNEIGTIQRIKEIGEICRKKKVIFHTDAVQAFGKIPIDVKKINIDLLTASSHKIYGPKGAACLYIKKGVDIEPLFHGGGQEMGIRPSTVNVPAIVGFSKACDLCLKEMKKEKERIEKLRNKLIEGVLKIKGSKLNGHPEKRLANNANFSFSFVEGESLVIKLDLKGIAVSTGSACSSMKLEPSYVLLALGLRPEQAHGSLRISLGRETKEEEIDYLLKILPEAIKELRDISPFK